MMRRESGPLALARLTPAWPEITHAGNVESREC